MRAGPHAFVMARASSFSAPQLLVRGNKKKMKSANEKTPEKKYPHFERLKASGQLAEGELTIGGGDFNHKFVWHPHRLADYQELARMWRVGDEVEGDYSNIERLRYYVEGALCAAKHLIDFSRKSPANTSPIEHYTWLSDGTPILFHVSQPWVVFCCLLWEYSNSILTHYRRIDLHSHFSWPQDPNRRVFDEPGLSALAAIISFCNAVADACFEELARTCPGELDGAWAGEFDKSLSKEALGIEVTEITGGRVKVKNVIRDSLSRPHKDSITIQPELSQEAAKWREALMKRMLGLVPLSAWTDRDVEREWKSVLVQLDYEYVEAVKEMMRRLAEADKLAKQGIAGSKTSLLEIVANLCVWRDSGCEGPIQSKRAREAASKALRSMQENANLLHKCKEAYGVQSRQAEKALDVLSEILDSLRINECPPEVIENYVSYYEYFPQPEFIAELGRWADQLTAGKDQPAETEQDITPAKRRTIRAWFKTHPHKWVLVCTTLLVIVLGVLSVLIPHLGPWFWGSAVIPLSVFILSLVGRRSA